MYSRVLKQKGYSRGFPVDIKPFLLVVFILFILLRIFARGRQTVIPPAIFRLESSAWGEAWRPGGSEHRTGPFAVWWVMGGAIDGDWQKIQFCLLRKLIVKRGNMDQVQVTNFLIKKRRYTLKHLKIVPELNFLTWNGKKGQLYKYMHWHSREGSGRSNHRKSHRQHTKH